MIYCKRNFFKRSIEVLMTVNGDNIIVSLVSGTISSNSIFKGIIASIIVSVVIQRNKNKEQFEGRECFYN